jgi:hypothetical protein
MTKLEREGGVLMRLVIDVPEETAAKIQAIAELEDANPNDVIETMTEDWLEGYANKSEVERKVNNEK